MNAAAWPSPLSMLCEEQKAVTCEVMENKFRTAKHQSIKQFLYNYNIFKISLGPNPV